MSIVANIVGGEHALDRRRAYAPRASDGGGAVDVEPAVPLLSSVNGHPKPGRFVKDGLRVVAIVPAHTASSTFDPLAQYTP